MAPSASTYSLTSGTDFSHPPLIVPILEVSIYIISTISFFYRYHRFCFGTKHAKPLPARIPSATPWETLILLFTILVRAVYYSRRAGAQLEEDGRGVTETILKALNGTKIGWVAGICIAVFLASDVFEEKAHRKQLLRPYEEQKQQQTLLPTTEEYDKEKQEELSQGSSSSAKSHTETQSPPPPPTSSTWLTRLKSAFIPPPPPATATNVLFRYHFRAYLKAFLIYFWINNIALNILDLWQEPERWLDSSVSVVPIMASMGLVMFVRSVVIVERGRRFGNQAVARGEMDL